MGKHRAAIVGCGRMGTEHGRAYAARPDVDLVAIADSDPENLAAFGDRFGVPGRARYADYLSGGLQSLLDAVEHGGEPLTSGDDMRRVLEIAIALRESARGGRVPVSLPIADRSLKIIPRPHRWLGAKPVAGGD